MTIKPGSRIHFTGIGGTGMAAVAGLAQEAGHIVTGSDQDIYPPMSTMLEELGISVATPYGKANVVAAEPDVVVVANALSRGNQEVEHVIESGIPYTSFPKLLGDLFLESRISVVVAGTHGKTTTTSLLAHMLESLGEEPGFMIGGLPRNFPRSFRLGKGRAFVIEGDEYDTAFFDKNSKFLHYHPNHLILNNLEFDHADIFADLEAIMTQFVNLVALVPDPRGIIANVDDANLVDLLNRTELIDRVTRVSTQGKSADATVRVLAAEPDTATAAQPYWTARIATRLWGELTVRTTLSGTHNIANIAQAIACIGTMSEAGALRKKPTVADLSHAVATFEGVRRRLDHLGGAAGVDVFEDFAHHPTAIEKVIDGFRKAYPSRRLLVAFEPRNATSRRNVFLNQFAGSLQVADRVYIGKCPVDVRIPESQRMDTHVLEEKIGAKAKAFPENEDLLAAIAAEAQSGDAIIFMSSGSFSGVQYRLPTILKDKFTP